MDAFERAVADIGGAPHGVALSSGTAALHAAMHAIGIGPGDEVIVPAMTFAATGNAVVYQGGVPVVADVDPDTLCLDPEQVRRNITPRTRAVVCMDYAGQPCDYDLLGEICRNHSLPLVADSCHALGGSFQEKPLGSIADLTVFSFHPVKHITTGEGGMVVTASEELAGRMRRFRNHGIDLDQRERRERNQHGYRMIDLGYNYRITDLQCALGVSQLKKLNRWLARRQEIASRYLELLQGSDVLLPLERRPDREHAWHLFVVRVSHGRRDALFTFLQSKKICTNVHYPALHLHPYYRKRFGYGPGLCPVAEQASGEVLSLPIFPAMTDGDVRRVCEAIHEFAA